MNRKSAEIYIWMLRHDHTVTGIAKAIKRSPSLVTATIRCRKNNRRVLRWFVEHGCPVDMLGLPEDMREAA